METNDVSRIVLMRTKVRRRLLCSCFSRAMNVPWVEDCKDSNCGVSELTPSSRAPISTFL